MYDQYSPHFHKNDMGSKLEPFFLKEFCTYFITPIYIIDKNIEPI